MKSSPLLNSVWAVNFFVTIHQILKKFPLLNPLQFLFVTPSALINEFRARKLNRLALQARISRRGKTENLDHLTQLIPSAEEPPPKGREMQAIETISVQILLAGYEPPSSQFLCTIMFSLLQPEMQDLLIREVREAFERYEDITPDALAEFQVLNACLMESLRLTVIGGSKRSFILPLNWIRLLHISSRYWLSLDGQPRVSPGTTVDGTYIAKGVSPYLSLTGISSLTLFQVTVQYSHFGFTRSTRYFHDPQNFRPQRWLPEAHPSYDMAFKNDARDSFFPFSLGPRSCPGMALAWRETRLFVAKVLWSFDVEMVEGQSIYFDRDFDHFGMWKKPRFFVRLIPVRRDE